MKSLSVVGGICIALTAAGASGAAGAPAASAAAPGGHVTLEAIPGSTVKRVTLSARAYERLGIEIGKVSEQPIVRKQLVGGLVIPPMDRNIEPRPAGGGFAGYTAQPANPAGKFAQLAAAPASARAAGNYSDPPGRSQAPAATLASATHAGALETASDAFGGAQGATTGSAIPGSAVGGGPGEREAWVLVTLSQGEWERVAKDKPARLLPLATRDQPKQEVLAKPSGMPPVQDTKRSMLNVYYVVNGGTGDVMVNKRMRVELELAGTGDKHKVVPYGSIYYDAKGVPWVYVNTSPLQFERRPVKVERVVRDLAVLADGPAVGTPVVTVGAALLFGAEIFGK